MVLAGVVQWEGGRKNLHDLILKEKKRRGLIEREHKMILVRNFAAKKSKEMGWFLCSKTEGEVRLHESWAGFCCYCFGLALHHVGS